MDQDHKYADTASLAALAGALLVAFTVGCQSSNTVESQRSAVGDSLLSLTPTPTTVGPEDVCAAPFIAEVTVDELWDLRARSTSGVVATPPTSEPLAVPTASMDAEVFQPILLSIDQMHQGNIEPAASILTAELHEVQFGYYTVHEQRRMVDTHNLEVGDKAFVFLGSTAQVQGHLIYSFLRSEALVRNDQNLPTVPSVIWSWYHIVGSNATNDWWPDLSLTELRARVAACASP